MTEKFHKIAEKLYQQQGAAGAGPDMSGMAGGAAGAAGNDGNASSQGSETAGGANGDNVVDADFTVVDEDEKDDKKN